MRQLGIDKRAEVIGCLVEGNSIRATCRLTNVCKDTILKLLCDIGQGAQRFHNFVARDLPCRRLEFDEIWAFCKMKDRHVPPDLADTAGIGSVWTWLAFDSDSKFIVDWLVGPRDADTALKFVKSVFPRLRNRVQVTTDGYRPYAEAVERVVGADVDYAMLVKMYGNDGAGLEKRRGGCIGTQRQVLAGQPDPKLISTSLVERQNLTLRMSNRRFTRKTNALSKKIENHRYAVALHFVWYNFCRLHQTLRVTPAMEIGLDNHVWRIEELITRILSPTSWNGVKTM